jgi:hypothetical protein
MLIQLGKKPGVHKLPLGIDRHRELNVFGGRLPAPDPRNANFRYRAVRRQLSAQLGIDKARRRRAWGVDVKRLPVDQGPTPRCVGFSIATCAVVGPTYQRKQLPTTSAAEMFANAIYFDALKRDEWAGEDDAGTSVNAGMKAAVAAGLFKSYAWGENVADVFDFGIHFGPVEMGTIWPDSMMDVDRFGYLNIAPDASMDGQHAAGHAWPIVTFDMDGKNPDGTVGFVEMVQSWGKPWGIKGTGRARMTVTTLATLIMAGADIAFGTEVALKPKPAIVAGADSARAEAA